MDFLKRHYEKITLVGLFILFIFLMWLITHLDEGSKEISETDLKVMEEKQDYKSSCDPEAIRKEVSGIWEDDNRMQWRTSTARGDVDSVNYSDLVQAYRMALCPFCEKEGDDRRFLIPFSAFGKSCPLCKKSPLPKPEEGKRGRRGIITRDDSDGDGIPNAVERKFGLNENDPHDALYDKDNDGFSNLYEIEHKTDPTSGKSSPPHWHRLVLTKIETVDLPFTLMVVNDNGKPNDPKEWEITYNEDRPNMRPRSNFARIGDIVMIERREYKVTGIKRIVERARVEVTNANINQQGNNENAVRNIDRSEVYLEENIDMTDERNRGRQPDRLTMIRGRKLHSSDKRPVLLDTGFPDGSRVYIPGRGDTISVPENTKARRPRTRRYRVLEVNEQKNIVKLADLSAKVGEGESVPVVELSTKAIIPEDLRVVQQVNQTEGMAGGDVQ